MNIVVCLKQVPSTETKVRINTRTGFVDESEVEWVVNPYDEYAIEIALRIREKLGDTTVKAVTLGPERVRTALKTALAMGVDDAAHVQGGGLEGIDPLSTGRVLARAIGQEPFDLVLCGKQAVDDDMAMVPQAIAHYLGIPHVAVVPEVEVEREHTADGAQQSAYIVAHREVEGATEVVHVQMPCLLTIQKGGYQPRYPTLKLMMVAKRKEIPVLEVAGLGIEGRELTRGMVSVGDRLPPTRKPGRTLEGGPDAVPELVRLLHEEAKVI